jgi:hypothetical protein
MNDMRMLDTSKIKHFSTFFLQQTSRSTVSAPSARLPILCRN